ncbi:RQC domain-containing protein [Desulfofundulus kuznetsovii]|uniref:RQC domain-containing protein n=1 Tax=Desulfofundulus kuznetsovii TaxID=58135 RepID=UPI00338E5B1A
MKILNKSDSQWVREIFRRVMEQKGCVPRQQKSFERIRVSKKGHVLLDNSMILSNSFLKREGALTENGMEKLLSTLLPAAVEKIKDALDSPPNRCPLPALNACDFAAETEPGEEPPALLLEKFAEYHRDYSARLRKFTGKVFDGLAPFPEFESESVAARAGCVVSPETFSVVRRRDGRWVLTCGRCGLIAVFPSIEAGKPQPDQIGTNIDKDMQIITLYAASAWSKYLYEDGIINEAERCAKEAEEKLAGHIYSKELAAKLHELKTIAGNLKRGELTLYGDSLAVPGPKPPVPVRAVGEYLASVLTEINAGQKMSVEEVRHVLCQTWGESGKELWEKAQNKWAGLPALYRLLPAARRAYERLSAFAGAWEQGKIKVIGGVLHLGGESFATPDGQTALSILEHHFRQFEDSLTGRELLGDIETIKKVLQYIADNQGEVGVTTAVAVLTGSRASKIMQKGYDKSPYYGILRGQYTQQKLAELVNRLVREGLLTVKYIGYYELPVLHVPKAVQKALGELEKGVSTEEKKDRLCRMIDTAVKNRSWEELGSMVREGEFAAEVVLVAASIFWPTGKAAKVLTEVRKTVPA